MEFRLFYFSRPFIYGLFSLIMCASHAHEVRPEEPPSSERFLGRLSYILIGSVAFIGGIALGAWQDSKPVLSKDELKKRIQEANMYASKAQKATSYEEAITLFTSALEIVHHKDELLDASPNRREGLLMFIASIYRSLGICYQECAGTKTTQREREEYTQKEQKSFQESLKYYQELGNKDGEATVYICLASGKVNVEKYKEALECLKSACELKTQQGKELTFEMFDSLAYVHDCSLDKLEQEKAPHRYTLNGEVENMKEKMDYLEDALFYYQEIENYLLSREALKGVQQSGVKPMIIDKKGIRYNPHSQNSSRCRARIEQLNSERTLLLGQASWDTTQDYQSGNWLYA